MNKVELSFCSFPIDYELFDSPSRFHIPFIINYHVEKITDPITERNFGRTNLGKTRVALRNVAFEEITEDDAFIEQWEDNYLATVKIERNIKKLINILNVFTPLKRVRSTWIDKHPWLGSSKQYELTNTLKKEAHRNNLLFPSEINLERYKSACRANFEAYDLARTSYLERVLDETRSSTNVFYKIMKSGSTSSKDLPPTMSFKGNLVRGNDRLSKIAEFLGSSFLSEVPDFGVSNVEIDNRLIEIYH